MFKAVEHKFMGVEYVFKGVEHKFKGVEHKTMPLAGQKAPAAGNLHLSAAVYPAVSAPRVVIFRKNVLFCRKKGIN